jgi:polynucleotide 5'-hydroxyl-kinase GRC3/NOL9
VQPHQAVVERVAQTAGVVLLFGGLDTGKTTLGRAIAAAGLRNDRQVAYLDADLGQKAVGPPATVALKMIAGEADLVPDAMSRPDAIAFVGSISPQGQLLPLVVGATRLLDRALDAGADLVVVDTSGLVSGVYGQILKYHKVEMLRPDVVIGLQRGAELDQLLGVVNRFFPTDVISLPVHPDVVPTSVEERAAFRERAMRSYFAEPLQRWRIKPTVFMPALPTLFELSQLHRLLVGLSDGKGDYIGLGILDHVPDEDALRLITSVNEQPKALKLGSVRVEPDYRVRKVDLRNLFGTD